MDFRHKPDYDVIAVGAGFSGLALIHYIREAGLSTRVFDKASDIGGTWTWNRYPGAASDIECYYYCLTFSRELLQDWSWSVRHPGWEENLRYMHFVADRCNMWPHIQLETRIVGADFQEDTGLWRIRTEAGDEFTCRYFVSAMGMISEPVIPSFAGMDRFKGPLFHSARWPAEGLDYAGKRIGIIGSGATTGSICTVVAQTAAQVTVFQRTANFIMPAVQKPMTPEWERDIKANYDAIVDKCRNHVFDIVVLATGFQAYTGAQEALPIRGRDGRLLRDKLEDVSSSIMGVFGAGFPNLFMVTGPQAPFADLPTSIEQNVIYIRDCISRMEQDGYDLCLPKQEAEDAWVAHTADIHRQTLMAQGDKVHSRMMGANLEQRKPRVLIYFGGANVYYDKLRESAAAGFPQVAFDRLVQA